MKSSVRHLEPVAGNGRLSTRRPLWTFQTLLIAFALVISAGAASAQRPVFNSGIVVGGDWLQANALPMDRDALQSFSLTAAWRRPAYSVEAGWLRVARTLSTVQGVTVAVGRPIQLGPALFVPAVGALGGKAYASNDSTGYNFIGPDGVPGHQPRYTYSEGVTFGGSVGLTVEAPVYRWVGIRLDVAEWVFSGSPVADDRFRTTLGAGLSLKVRR